MKRIFGFLTVAAFAGMLFAANAFAQSSGNFTYGTTGNTMGCVLLKNGSLSGGTSNCAISTGASTFMCTTDADCTAILGSNSGATCVNGFCHEPNPGTGGCIGSLQAAIKTSTGKGNVFDIRPSAVIGLLTDVTVSSKQGGTIVSSTAGAGIDFSVSVTGAAGVPTPAAVPGRGVPITYDARFIQISTNLFQAIATTCAGITNGCFLTFAESTDSAHSFDWVVGAPTAAGTGNSGPVAGATLQSGTYNVEVDWMPSSVFQVSGIAEAAACVGPVNLTVQQNKIFSFDSVNQF